MFTSAIDTDTSADAGFHKERAVYAVNGTLGTVDPNRQIESRPKSFSELFVGEGDFLTLGRDSNGMSVVVPRVMGSQSAFADHENIELTNKHQELTQKKFEFGLSDSESKVLRMVHWALDQCEMRRKSVHLDRMDDLIRAHKQMVSQVEQLLHVVR